MRTRTFRIGLLLGVGVASVLTLAVIADPPATIPPTTDSVAPPDAPAPADNTPVKLPYGVEDVLKLSRAQVGDDVTLNYIQNSGTIYNLTTKDIIYLKNEGVSDQVIKAMSDQARNVPAEAAATSATQGSAAPSVDPTQVSGTIDPGAPASVPMYAQPVPVYVQQVPVPVPVPVPAAPAPAPGSTLYIIPDTASGATAPFYPSGYLRGYAGVSTVIAVGGGYGGHRYYSSSYRGGYGRGVVVIGRH